MEPHPSAGGAVLRPVELASGELDSRRGALRGVGGGGEEEGEHHRRGGARVVAGVGSGGRMGGEDKEEEEEGGGGDGIPAPVGGQCHDPQQ